MSESNEATRRSALVTGSSRGIGLAVATELASAGFDVCSNTPMRWLPNTVCTWRPWPQTLAWPMRLPRW